MTDFAKLVLDADTRGLKRAERDLDGVSRTAQSTARKVGISMTKLGAGLTAGVTAPLAFFGKQAVQTAIDAQEMESAFDVVFGNMSDDVRAWAIETGDALGRSTQEVQRGALAFQELFGKALDPAQAAEFSKEFAVLTQDLASFKNLSNEVAQQKLFSGLVGEAEPLRAVGVFLNAAAVSAKAAELGIEGVNGKLTDQQKIVARAAIIQEQLAQAQGDVLRTNESTANQIKRSQAAFEELQVVIGTKLLPAITPLIEKLGAAFEWFSKLPDPVQEFALGAAILAAALGPILLIVGSLITLGAALGAALLPVAAVVAAVAAAGYLLATNWDKIAPIFDRVGEAINEAIGPKTQALIATLTEKFNELWNGPLGEGIRRAADFLKDFGATYLGVLGETWLRVLDAAITAFGGVVGGIVDGLTVISRLMQGDFRGAFEATLSFINGIQSTILGVINALIPEVVSLGRDMILGLVNGIKANGAKVWSAIKGVVLGGIERAKALLGIKSPSLVFMGIGKFVSEGLALGITSGGKMVGEAVSSLADTAQVQSVQVQETFKQMAEGVLRSLQGLAGSIKNGGFFDILNSVLGVGLQLAGAGAFGSNIQNSVNSVSGARANGGQVNSGRSYLVGEKGPELFTPSGHGRIHSNDNSGGTLTVRLEQDGGMTAYMEGVAAQVVSTAAPALVSAGGQAGVRRMQKIQGRRLG